MPPDNPRLVLFLKQIRRVFLKRVLFVPDLGSDNLLSWNAVCGMGFVKIGMGSDISTGKEIKGKEILWARKDHSSFVVRN